MGNAASSDAAAAAAPGAEAPISAENEHNALAMRMQAITGAKPAETRAAPRGPKAAQEDHPLIAVRDGVPGTGLLGLDACHSCAEYCPGWMWLVMSVDWYKCSNARTVVCCQGCVVLLPLLLCSERAPATS
eukprot:GHRQ01020343.1.p1 GENE.GHRQ01020343.1~~GHRQ01020343.1.p1  ORF type:complete len:131 (-),score=27.56 GHRQ01020343.1:437-829(-)